MEKERKLLVTMKDIKRYKILKELIDKKLTGSEAALLLGISYVHVSRLKKKLNAGGLEAILRHPPPSAPNKKITDNSITQILKLRDGIYYDFNIMHFKEKLQELHSIKLSYETLRQILINHKAHKPKKKKKVHRMRRRMPKAGMLIQMDSSEHRWLEHINEKWHLVATIDDGDNNVDSAKFFPKDTTYANMRIIKALIEKKGVFTALYTDKASHFTTTRHQGIHYNVNPEQDDTQIERALAELDITLIPANSPQAKGRVERLFRLFQDRLIKEMRLAGIKNYKQANQFLIDKFLPWYNARFAKKNIESAYTAVPVDKNLNLIFSIKKERVVNHDNTIQICNQIVQIPPTDIRLSFAKAVVDVCLLEDKRIYVLYKDKIIAESRLSGNNKILKKERYIESFIDQRKYELTAA